MEHYFIQQVILLAAKYNVKVKIDWERRIVDFQTNDEVLQNTIAFELEEIFK